MCAADDVASAAESDPINALCTCAAGVSLSGPNCWCCELPTNLAVCCRISSMRLLLWLLLPQLRLHDMAVASTATAEIAATCTDVMSLTLR